VAIAAGERNQALRIEYRASETPDGQGGRTPVWALRAVEYAKEEQLTASEALQASQQTSERTTAWTIPFRDDVSVRDRIRIGSRTLQIKAVANPDGRREDTRIVCTERAT
jgi:SPP1 family predicted phage head-tail adaptor